MNWILTIKWIRRLFWLPQLCDSHFALNANAILGGICSHLYSSKTRPCLCFRLTLSFTRQTNKRYFKVFANYLHLHTVNYYHLHLLDYIPFRIRRCIINWETPHSRCEFRSHFFELLLCVNEGCTVNLNFSFRPSNLTDEKGPLQ